MADVNDDVAYADDDVHLTCCRNCFTVWTYRIVDGKRVLTRGTKADVLRFRNAIEATRPTAFGHKGNA